MTARSSLVRGILRVNASRTRLMVAAVAVGITAVGSILGASTVIDRTITESFASTVPADAYVTIDRDASELLPVASAVDRVTGVEARREVTVRMASAEGWQRLTLVAVENAGAWRISRAFPVSGAWPPARGEIVIERSALSQVDLEQGDFVDTTSPHGQARLRVAGVAHDPGRTPAWMVGTVLGFVAPETLADVGVAGGLSTLAIRTTPGWTRDQNRAIAASVADAVATAGATVTDVSVPVPGKHPAQGVMDTLLYLLQAFGLVSLVAATALVATLVVAEVKRSTGAIAVMKTGGATSRQVAGVFLSALLAVVTLGLATGIAGGIAGTWALSRFAFTLLNLDATSMIASWWVFPVQGAVALVVPVVAVAVPLARLSRQPVKEGLAAGVSAPARAPRRTRVEGRLGRAVALGARNTVRQPARLSLTVASLAIGAAAVMASLNTGAAWDRIVGDEFAANRYDVQLQLASPVHIGSLDAAASAAHLSRIEYWNVTRAAITGPDGRVGDVATVLNAPRGSVSTELPLIDGRRLTQDDDHAALVSQSLTRPHVALGDRIRLAGDPSEWTVVGVVRQLGGGADGTVWVSEPLATALGGTANALRVTGVDEDQALAGAERMLATAGVGIVSAVTATDAKQSLDNHLYIISGLLLVMSVGLGVVGLIGLVEAMSTAVAERGGEIALMKTVGASSRAITRIVVTEALAIAALAAAAAVVIAVPLTAVVQSATGTIFTGAPLPYTWWLPGVAITLIGMAGAATASSIVPAYEAADRPVRDVLARG